MEQQKKRILVADGFEKTQQLIESTQGFDQYEFMFVRDGESCKLAIAQFHPDLLLIELFLPHLHGIQVLKWMKKDIKYRSIGTIVMTYELMLQNYRSALEAGADYFLDKPFNPNHLFLLFERFFANELKSDPFQGEPIIDFGIDSYYDPQVHIPTSYLKFWGTRGSISVAGEKYVRMGGNTPCLEIRTKKTSLIIDSGTGIRPLGELILEHGKNNNINLLISHTHQDHILGFPFFYPLYSEKNKITVWSPVGFEKTTEGLFKEMLAYSFFPVRLEQMRATVEFADLHDSKSYDFNDIQIGCHYTYHPGPTLGFKISVEGHKIGYITDNEFLVGYHGHPNDIPEDHPLLDSYRPLINFLHDCDVIVHEAQYFPKEYEQKVGWGHSSITNATILFKNLPNCKHWIVTHHDPRHTDQMLALKQELHWQIMIEAGVKCYLSYAYDGMIYPILKNNSSHPT